MRKFNVLPKDLGYLAYRLIEPVIDPIKFIKGLYGYFSFFKDMISYKSKSPKEKLLGINLFPSIHDKTSFTSFDSHYYYQQLWAFEKILKIMPKMHVDIASSYHFSGYVSKITKSVFVDYRPIKADIKNLEVKKGDILDLEFFDNTVESLSCLHVIEHIGLGRYGDAIDPEGMAKACSELSRVLKVGGRLYVSTVIGKERLCFNSHRITPTIKVISMFQPLKLVSFSVVDDNGRFYENTQVDKYDSQDYACGMFEFTKD